MRFRYSEFKTLLLLVIVHIVTGFVTCVGSAKQSGSGSGVESSQDPSCGQVSLIPGDARTEAPWTVGIFLRPGPKKNYNFYTTGVVISPTIVLSLVGGKFAANTTRLGVTHQYTLPEIENIVVGAGLRSTDLRQRDTNSQFAQVSHVVPFRRHEDANREFHFVLYHLKRPLNTTTPYVRSTCFVLPGTLLLGNRDMLHSGFIFSENDKNVAKLTTIGITSSNDPVCGTVFKRNYGGTGGHVFCGTASQTSVAGTSSSCLRHGSPVVFKPVKSRWYLAGLTALIPSLKQGHCTGESLYIYARTSPAVNWIVQNIKCSKTGDFCQAPECFPWTSGQSESVKCGDEENSQTVQLSAFIPSMTSQKSSSTNGVSIANRDFDKISGQQSCLPLPLSAGVKAECIDVSTASNINCSLAVVNTHATLRCETFYTSKYRFPSVDMKCGEDRRWTPYKPFACEPDCGILSSDYQPLLTNGKITNKNNAFPWHAAIFRISNGQYAYICGGSLIDKFNIISAAHCVHQLSENPTAFDLYRVVLAPASSNFDYNLNDEIAQVFQIAQVFIPPTYNKRTLKSDIAIIRLSKPVTFGGFIRPVCYLLPYFTQAPSLGSLGKVAGFGVDESGSISESLKYADFPVVSGNYCRKSVAGLPRDSAFCAGFGNGSVALCRGDSGGGIAFPEARRGSGVQRYTLKGIVSSGQLSGNSRGCEVENYAAFTHVDWFGDWIIDVLERSAH